MGKEDREIEPRFGMVNFERRRHPRFVVDLPVEYWKIRNFKSCPSRATNVSEGGLLVFLSEQLEIGQNLRLNLFVDAGPDLNSIEAVVEVVWKDIDLGKDGEYRTGVKFLDISAEAMDELKSFLNSLANLKSPSTLRIPSQLASTLTNFSTPRHHKQK
jgi:c-di-GMP-binding flagellar brake protein YcgR